MERLHETLSQQLGRSLKPSLPVPQRGRAYRCRCGQPLFFGNNQCLKCGVALGFEPDSGLLLPLDPGAEPGVWVAADGAEYTRCANHDNAALCNWLLPRPAPAEAPARGAFVQTLCRCCRLNRVIPDQTDPAGREAWASIEVAKRRLVSQLIALGLPVASKLSEDWAHGLAFDFLRQMRGAPPVITGHAGGIVTLNIEEADDEVRERLRRALREPNRTLLGHLRHEVGHYYWDRLVEGTPWHEPWRALFGDETWDYQGALQRHYRDGPPWDWPARHVSAYAASHPWEDWAETWAHYLHMRDALDTASGFGLDASDVDLDTEPFSPEVLGMAPDAQTPAFMAAVNAWVELSALLNELARSMGQPDICPFVLSPVAVRKLHFVHRVVRAAAGAGP